jgi:hypothetical protein
MKPFAISTAIVLMVIAIVHAMRIALGWPVSIDSVEIPMWASVVSIVVILALCFGLVHEARALPDDRLTLDDLTNLLRLNMKISMSQHLLKNAFPPSLENEGAQIKCKAFAETNHCKVSFDTTFKTVEFERRT